MPPTHSHYPVKGGTNGKKAERISHKASVKNARRAVMVTYDRDTKKI